MAVLLDIQIWSKKGSEDYQCSWLMMLVLCFKSLAYLLLSPDEWLVECPQTQRPIPESCPLDWSDVMEASRPVVAAATLLLERTGRRCWPTELLWLWCSRCLEQPGSWSWRKCGPQTTDLLECRSTYVSVVSPHPIPSRYDAGNRWAFEVVLIMGFVGLLMLNPTCDW